MSRALITEAYLEDIASAIRGKNGSSNTYTPPQMAAAIQAIPTGITPTGTLEITENGTYDVTQYASVSINVSGGGGSVTIVPWATGTDAEIAAMIDAAHAGTIDLQTDGGWAVGDVRTISVASFVAGNQTIPARNVNIVISSFNDYMNCGCLLQFDFKTLLDTLRMNPTATNIGGYGATEIKTDVLPALVGAMPDWLSEHLLTFNVLASAGNRSTNIETVSNNKLALRSEIEVFGSCTYSASGEGSQLEYYTNESNRIKKDRYNANKTWWLRSPRLTVSSDFCRVNSDGTPDYIDANSANYTYLAPFGCL